MVRTARKDALENRARIVEVARREIAASSTAELRLNAIAKEAGVGQGTLYRHFPTREALLVEVYRQEVDDLVDLAPRLLETAEPVDALARWFDRVAQYARVKRGVLAAVEASVWRDLTTHSLGPIGDAITLLLDAGRAAGQIRDDVDAGDVIVLIGYLSRLDDDEWDQRAHRPLHIILDGLRRRGS
ncbi:transcriptional regulator, TetR family [Promicromonospora umidemergens]|uniref:TetR/AcrR family transcriptional regulator n=1 Tax=Promicromonospora umidemergens TaxID=629679 RepID=A0ABP8XMD5_9MICO|nr:TetR/AcrR family transcriptional regulator [Promicromonospora umidemergens]MCP2285677.1 transcriptional regulator, TetR family [Promicromonospora umidemergens]